MSHGEYELAFQGSPEVGYLTRRDFEVAAETNGYDSKTTTIVWSRINQIASGRINDRKYILDPELGHCELGIVDPEEPHGEMTHVNGDTFLRIVEDPTNEFHRPTRIGAKAVELSWKALAQNKAS